MAEAIAAKAQARRRTKGSGSVQEWSPGKYRIRLFVGTDPLTGHPRQIQRIVQAKNATQARTQLDLLKKEFADVAHVDTSATVQTVIEEYFRHSESRGRAPKTLHEGRRIAERVIYPALGDIPAKDLTARHLDELYRRLRMGEGPTGRKLSPATVRRYHAVISASMGQAVRWGWIDRNPAERAEPPEVDKGKQKIPTVDEVRRLALAAHEVKPEWGILVKLAVLTGSRRGELCALRWPDVGPDTIRFARSIYRAGAQRGEKATKSGRERIVSLGPGGVALLADWRNRCVARALDADAELVPDAFLASPTPDGSRPMNPDSFSSAIHRLCAPYDEKHNPSGLGIPHVHLHSLRHFAATLALQSGVDARNVAELLGHADGGVLILGTYAHATTAVQRQAAEALDSVW
jgi:integrase